MRQDGFLMGAVFLCVSHYKFISTTKIGIEVFQ